MFTAKAQQLIDRAKGIAAESNQVTLDALLRAIDDDFESKIKLAQAVGLSPEKIQVVFPEPQESIRSETLRMAPAARAVVVAAIDLSKAIPDRVHPGLINVKHLIGSLAMSSDACSMLGVKPRSRTKILKLLDSWDGQVSKSPQLHKLTATLKELRSQLLARVFGQDHAIHDFVEGFFNAEVDAAADQRRKSPQALFVFAGPPGVGKTYLAETGASYLERPFKRFDMSSFSDPQSHYALVGMSKSFQGAHQGLLTGFVKKNPKAVLLFDEIEKAHINTIHLFLQLLDAGTLEDKFEERNVSFRDTSVIFTTNAGRKLYDRPNFSGVNVANGSFHRKTILDALENEVDPRTRQPFFPAAICSRMATGYPVLFNHLRINELEQVAAMELGRVGKLLEDLYHKQISFHEALPMCLVLREGARVDARTLRSQSESFVKSELFKFCRLFDTDRLEDVFDRVDNIRFELEGSIAELASDVRSLFDSATRPQILLIADSDLASLYKKTIPEVEWKTSHTAEDALDLLAQSEIDVVLLDLWLGRSVGMASQTIESFDHVPLGARSLEKGQELLRKIRDRLPDIPVYLLSLMVRESNENSKGSVDEELFLACVQGGGARGLITTSFTNNNNGSEVEREQFTDDLINVSRKLHREKSADRLGQERKVLSFDTAPLVDHDHREVTIRLRNLRLSRAIASADAGEVLDDVERPRTKFEDVIGATAAKVELQFFIDFLKNPKRFAALKLKPPKGILLHGPPGTGKTMLARAMAGESDVAFITATGSQFVTMWQGSGPQAMRDLFLRARRYAPAIVFIDEIDTIGKVRSGSAGAGQAEENTLNALLTEMDGFSTASPNRPVFVLAATNFKVETDNQDAPERSRRTLDPALVRRFSRTILVDLPERSSREQYLSLRLERRPSCTVSENMIKMLAERSVGMTIANLESLIETAGRSAIQAEGVLTDELLEEAFERVKFGDARPRDLETVKRTARHEAGHTVMYWLKGWWPSYVTVVSRGGHGGYMQHSADEVERRGLATRDDLLADIRVALGGRAAELTYYGSDAGVTTGASGDLEHATNVARQMVSRYGMDEEFGLLATPELTKYEGALSSPVYIKVNEAAGKILREQMQLTMGSLEKNRHHLDAVSDALIRRERLTASELREILPDLRE